jgi:exonuclease VII small subunit
MRADYPRFEKAISLVDQELSFLREERRAYEEFREEVSLSIPDSANATRPSETTEEIQAAYREEVMETLDYETVYGDTVADSLEAELSPTIAETILSKKPLTQRRKRELLVQTTAAIEHREELCAELSEELAALESFAEELAKTEETLDKLPRCTAEEQPLEKLLVVWEGYELLMEHCEQLLERRQQQIQQTDMSNRILGEHHLRNEYLYSELDTRYPILSELADVSERIAVEQNGKQSIDWTARSIHD